MMRVGTGYDVHRLVAGRPLRLGGVTVPHDRGLEGHSDADVALHAIADAALGAAALGDLGRHFPPGDPATAGADSGALLAEVVARLAAAGWAVENADCTIVAEKPHLAPYIGAMRERIATLLGVALEAVSVKATTTEGLGVTGREEAIAAQAVVLLRARPAGRSP